LNSLPLNTIKSKEFGIYCFRFDSLEDIGYLLKYGSAEIECYIRHEGTVKTH
jgi:hypothetical protein